MSDYILEMTDVSKTFPGVKALQNVTFRLRPGTVHALMGENGAGKSTLMKCLIGLYQMNGGKILINGKETAIRSPLEAARNGIAMIHQELSTVVERSVAENIFLGRQPTRGKIFVDHKRMYKDADELLKSLNINIDPHEKMGNLSVARMQLVEIAKAISYNSAIIIMDEPTSALTTKEVDQLFDMIRNLKKKGVSVIYISHKLDEIFQVADEVTVFRDGHYIGSDDVKNMDVHKLITMMVGRDLDEMYPKVDCPITDVILEVQNLSAGGAFHDVSFSLRRGEILGLAGLMGAGRTEVLETLFGLRKKTSGKVIVHGKDVDIKEPSDAKKYGFALITEDRHRTGIIPVSSVGDNIVVANLKKYISKLHLISHKKMNSDSIEYIDKLNIKTTGTEVLVQDLSGGNQQKVLVARWLLTNPEILLVDEPTRGIDVGAKAEIHSLITRMAGEGKAVIMASSEMPEILGMCDRILVMHEGKLTGELGRAEANQERIMEYATNI
jgi:methyl-galactoside transport system ATP-binding protein/inositol transport system ATP-binding protein